MTETWTERYLPLIIAGAAGLGLFLLLGGKGSAAAPGGTAAVATISADMPNETTTKLTARLGDKFVIALNPAPAGMQWIAWVQTGGATLGGVASTDPHSYDAASARVLGDKITITSTSQGLTRVWVALIQSSAQNADNAALVHYIEITTS